MNFFESLKEEKPKQEVTETVKRTYTPRPPRPKKDHSKAIMDFSRVVNCIHVNIHQTHRDTLTEIIGSFKVAAVRKYLTDKFLEALKE